MMIVPDIRAGFRGVLPEPLLDRCRRIAYSPRACECWSWWIRQSFRARPPRTLNEKIRWRMATDRRPILTQFADKLAVREYVTKTVGAQHLPVLYLAAHSIEEIVKAELPPRYVLKPTNGSSAVLFVDSEVDPSSNFPKFDRKQAWPLLTAWVHPTQLASQDCAELVRRWLTRTYSPYEWAYRNIQPHLIAEEWLVDEAAGSTVPRDYKLWCFNGRVAFIQVDLERFERHQKALFLPDWSPIDGEISYPRPAVCPDPPPQLDSLIRIAQALAAPVDMVRVDLYDIGDRVIVGELTNYPEAGIGAMDPEELFSELATDWIPSDVSAT
jgi:hypothetical protein